MRTITYVDSLYGIDSPSNGALNSPVRSLSYAYTNTYEGGTIVLQTGDGTSYGALNISKNISIQSAYGSEAKVGTLILSEAQGSFLGLTFDTIPKGIVISNSGYGAVGIKECKFLTVETAIDLQQVQYISIHRNYFENGTIGLKIDSAYEVTASANTFATMSRAVDINSLQRLDLYGNTIYGASSLTPIDPDANLRIVYKLLTSSDIVNKRVSLPSFAVSNSYGYDVAMNVVNGPSFSYGVDYTVPSPGIQVNWAGLRLEDEFAVGDLVRIMYSEGGDPVSGNPVQVLNAVDQNSRIDSNNINNASLGVYFTSPLKIRHNNFYSVSGDWWDGAVPTGSTGIQNIDVDPQYVDQPSNDFRLQSTSPDIDAGDPGRWADIYREIGIEIVDGAYTGSYTGPIRDNVAPFNRDIDYPGYHRGVTGIHGVTGDIGSYEYNRHETALGNYVDERGYDYAHPGSETASYASVDRGFDRAGNQNLFVDTNFVPTQGGVTGPFVVPSQGYAYGRYRSKNIVLSNSELAVGNQTGNDTVVIYPSYPSYETGAVYVSPDGSDAYTGTYEAPYRTITRALEDSKDIILSPGYYPTFKGESGVRLIGLEETKTVDYEGEQFSGLRSGSWTGVGSYSTTSRRLSLTDTTSIGGEFVFTGEIDFEFTATCNGSTLSGGVDNDSNSVYVTINNTGLQVIMAYCTDSNLYEVYGPVTDVSEMVGAKVSIRIRDDKIRITVKNSHIDFSKQATLGASYADPWHVFFGSTGLGTSYADNVRVGTSDTFTGSVTGITGVDILKKGYGIYGVTGVQG